MIVFIQNCLDCERTLFDQNDKVSELSSFGRTDDAKAADAILGSDDITPMLMIDLTNGIVEINRSDFQCMPVSTCLVNLW